PRLRGAPGGEDGIEAAGALPRAAHFGVGQTRAVRAPSPGAAQLRRRSAPAPRGEALTGATRGGARPSKGAGGGAKASGGPFGGSRPGGIGRGGSAPGRRRRRAPRVSREVRVGEGGRGRLGDGGAQLRVVDEGEVGAELWRELCVSWRRRGARRRRQRLELAGADLQGVHRVAGASEARQGVPAQEAELVAPGGRRGVHG